MRPGLVYRIDVSVERLRRLSTIIIPFSPYRIRLELSEVPPFCRRVTDGRIRQCPSSRCFGNIWAREAVSCVPSEKPSRPSGEKYLAMGRLLETLSFCPRPSTFPRFVLILAAPKLRSLVKITRRSALALVKSTHIDATIQSRRHGTVAFTSVRALALNPSSPDEENYGTRRRNRIRPRTCSITSDLGRPLISKKQASSTVR
jgi:hypothetical protein